MHGTEPAYLSTGRKSPKDDFDSLVKVHAYYTDPCSSTGPSLMRIHGNDVGLSCMKERTVRDGTYIMVVFIGGTACAWHASTLTEFVRHLYLYCRKRRAKDGTYTNDYVYKRYVSTVCVNF